MDVTPLDDQRTLGSLLGRKGRTQGHTSIFGRAVKPERLVCHSHTGFGVAVFFLVMAMSFNHQHGHVEDSSEGFASDQSSHHRSA